MAETTAFAFRLPPELKAAAKALTQTWFYVWQKDGKRTVRGVNPSSINEALVYLAHTGVRQTLEDLEPDVQSASREYEQWQGVAQFFLSNPAAERALPANFAEGSPARELVQEWIDDMQQQAETDESLADHPDISGTSRQEALDQLASAQRTLAGRVAAKGALQRALSVKI